MKNRVCDLLKIEKPIIQGPCNWLTNAEFVASISQAGGLGVLGFNAGLTESALTAEDTKENMRNEIKKVRAITARPIGLNIAPSQNIEGDLFTGHMLDLMVEEKVPVAVMVGELVPFWVDKFHEKGIKVVFRAATPTIKNTREAIKAGVDIIVATGFDEGGTVPEKVIGTFSVVPMIVDAAQGQVPVIAAGGIVDARTAKAAFVLGAEGLFVGTAFLLSEESIVAENIKQLAIESHADDLLMYRTIPAFYRSLPGELPYKLLEMSQSGATEKEIFDAQYAYLGMRNGMLLGDLSKGYASFGLGISMIHKIEPVATIIDKMMDGLTDWL